MATPASPPKRRLSWRQKLLLATLPVTLLFALGEWFARSYRTRQGYPPQPGHSYRDQRIDLIRRAFPTVHDDVLGYRPQPGFHGTENVWHTLVTIDADGLRSNGADAARFAGPPVLAVGDSFTFGDQVSDQETWPAQLEQRLSRPVRNGGVFGYGFDQTVLRAERLLDTIAADTVVCSLIPDDLKRCELSRRFSPKPWFAIIGDGIELRGVPVEDTSVDNELDKQWLRRTLGHSALLDMVFWNACRTWWVGTEREVREHPPGTGLTIGMKLLERLATKCRERGARLLLVLQGPEPEMTAGEPVRAPELLAYGRTIGVDVLDLATRFRDLADRDHTLDREYFHGHMTAAGNRWVAEQIAAELRAW
ncbi:MAG: hypothetical protein JNN13_02825 [Planctomycetes bacterium]|nr:hypothetical protein [Planctomycetota bacterium]